MTMVLWFGMREVEDRLCVCSPPNGRYPVAAYSRVYFLGKGRDIELTPRKNFRGSKLLIDLNIHKERIKHGKTSCSSMNVSIPFADAGK